VLVNPPQPTALAARRHSRTRYAAQAGQKIMPTQITLYHNPRCSKSRAVLQWLQQRDEPFETVEYLKTPPDTATLKHLLELLQISATDLVRKSEAPYKERLPDVKNYTDEQLIELMAQHPILIERPVVATTDNAAIGRPLENVIELFDDD
jgi:arsenate reductase